MIVGVITFQEMNGSVGEARILNPHSVLILTDKHKKMKKYASSSGRAGGGPTDICIWSSASRKQAEWWKALS